ncbi:1-phosphofructokinase [Bacillus sp. ISL-7]|uniref:1-phosphofructokinase n=1 Tax=Bacillus sp. ISL-7 TaxID=2819136 RepID=UPI001BE8B171|nr:1-phosphofructokinase [Bacillus sp. ISL-7]MBT2735993.1 1-phosphofructokinase [Bacillus sp. ISL-7]
MIYTCTLNPSVDYVVHVQDFQLGELNRMSLDVKYPGGKGINVSRVLKRAGVESKALGFIGGFTGSYVEEFLNEEGISTNFIHVNGDSRINIKLKTDETETEINGQGPEVSNDQVRQLIKQVESLQNDDILVLAGSIPSSLPSDFYSKLTKIAKKQGAKVVVDASGKVLLDIVEQGPFFIKPNHHELGELFDVTIKTPEEAIPYGQRLLELGAENVAISMAGKGALLITKEAIYQATVPKGTVKNSVGAGDSLVAGYLADYLQKGDVVEAFRTGVATGSATAFSLELCTQEDVERLIPKVEIKKIRLGVVLA